MTSPLNLDNDGMPLGWSMISLATALGWLTSNGMGLASLGFGIFGAVIQYKTYRLRVAADERARKIHP